MSQHTYIQNIRTESGDIVLPVTRSRAVYTDDNKTLEQTLKELTQPIKTTINKDNFNLTNIIDNTYAILPNELPYNSFDTSKLNSPVTHGGVTFTVNPDGSMTLNGTSTEEVSDFEFISFLNGEIDEALKIPNSDSQAMMKIVYVSGSCKLINDSSLKFYASLNHNKNEEKATPSEAEEKMMKLSLSQVLINNFEGGIDVPCSCSLKDAYNRKEDRYIVPRISIKDGTEFNNFTFKIMLEFCRNESLAKKHPYVPYGPYKIKVQNKNLMPKAQDYVYGEKVTINGITATVNSSIGSVKFSGTATKATDIYLTGGFSSNYPNFLQLNNGAYTFSLFSDAIKDDEKQAIKNKITGNVIKYTKSDFQFVSEEQGSRISFYVDSKRDVFGYCLAFHIFEGAVLENIKLYPMLEYGEGSLVFERRKDAEEYAIGTAKGWNTLNGMPVFAIKLLKGVSNIFCDHDLRIPILYGNSDPANILLQLRYALLGNSMQFEDWLDMPVLEVVTRGYSRASEDDEGTEPPAEPTQSITPYIPISDLSIL